MQSEIGRRRAFTLVEMLVVISIIAVLAALLLPAVNMAREAARRAQCSNNMRNLALAAQNFDSAKGYYPASRTFWNDATYKTPTTGRHPASWNTPAAMLTWVHEIMPYIERQDMRTLIEMNLQSGALAVPQAANGKLTIVFCPSDELDEGTPTAGQYSQLSYACNSGVMDNLAPQFPAITGFDWPQNGALDNRLKGLGDNQKTFKTSLGDITSGDGASNTILFAENSDLEEWNYAPTEFHAGIVWDDNASNYSLNNGTVSYVSPPYQWLNKYPPGLVPANIKPDTLLNIYGSSPYNVVPYARPLSQHPTGFMLAFCDGRVKFVSEGIDYFIYARLMSSNGKKYLPAGNQQLPAAYQPVRTMQMLPVGDY